MTGVPPPSERQPRTLWLIARTYFLADHEGVLDDVLSSMNGLDFEYIPRTVLAIQGLTVSDFVMLKLCHPSSRMIADEEGGCLVEDRQDFQALEQTLTCIASHAAYANLIIAEFALRNTKTFRMLEGKMAERPDVWQVGLQLLEDQMCLR